MLTVSLISRGTGLFSYIFKSKYYIFFGQGKPNNFFSLLSQICSYLRVPRRAPDIGLLWRLDTGLNGAFLWPGSAYLCNRSYWKGRGIIFTLN